MIIMLFIGLNMMTMTFDHYQQTPTFTVVLDYLNMIFICIFSTECLMKIFALRYHYFVEPWNLFDVVVVVLSILSTYDTNFSRRFNDTQVRNWKITNHFFFFSLFHMYYNSSTKQNSNQKKIINIELKIKSSILIVNQQINPTDTTQQHNT